MLPTLANWNGTEMPLDQVRVPALDRGFLFGDGVYETLRIYQGRVWLLDRHFQRLQRSLKQLALDCDVEPLRPRALRTLAHSGVSEGMLYVQITRGAVKRTHQFPRPAVAPNELIYVEDLGGDPYAAYRESGVGVVTFPDWRWGRRDIKSLNLLGNCLACEQAYQAGCKEAILVEGDGAISEGSHTSLFAVRDGVLLTAPTGSHILPGLTRAVVLEMAEAADIPCRQEAVFQKELHRVEELFLTGTTSEILGIATVDGEPVGNGKPGPLTRRLYATYHEAVRRWLSTQGET